jgi:isoamylase
MTGCPSHVIRLDPTTNRTYHYWHVFVPGLQAGQLYGYRVHGPFDPAKGLRFDPTKVLLDPYGRRVAVPRNYSREAAQSMGRIPPSNMLLLSLTCQSR